MGATRHRKYALALLGFGAAALIVDRAVLQPSAAGAATTDATPRSSRGAEAGPSSPAAKPLPPASVPVLAGRVGELEAPDVTPDVFRADPAEWGLPAPGATASARPAEIELRLGAIMNADAADAKAPGSFAVINSRIVRVGGSVAGYVVQGITPTSVLLQRGAETRELRLAR